MKQILKKHRFRLGLTLSLVVIESAAWILFPLFIGFAINDTINDQITGLINLGLLTAFALLTGSTRRYIDTRTYARIYEDIALEATMKSKKSVSVKSARLEFLTEVVEFMENTLPEFVGYLIAGVGSVVVLAFLSIEVFLASLLMLIAVSIVYLLTSGYTTRLNAGFNDEYERRVDAVKKGTKPVVKKHLKGLMYWKIKLSDLETVNISIAWMFVLALLLFSIAFTASAGFAAGAVFSIVLYVYELFETVDNIPLHYQEFLRLKEIRNRMRD